MGQKQLPVPPAPPPDDKETPLTRKLPEAPQADTLTDKIDKLESRKQRKDIAEPQCCGILPCKGRTQFCYECDICLDCITDLGCGHSNSRHTMKRIGENKSDE